MRVKSIVLDGFKSYAHRQELCNLDRHFNAITGLNGSGKSNIFDAICFVMGITNHKKLRAEDLSELIYKNGHAGIQRASVTIEFTNDDERSSPEAYPCHKFPIITVSRQILTGGRQKFFFNGKVTDQSKVKQFFHSVSLNVDNPHFLVLQGTVHKLVNMRPAEILGWLEEAAGTRVFDARRRASENLIAGREKKLAQIREQLETEIGPLMQSMKEEQQQYADYQRIVETLEEKRRFKAAFAFFTAMGRLGRLEEETRNCKERSDEARRALQQIPRQRDQLRTELQMAASRLDAPQTELEGLKTIAGEQASAAKARRRELESERKEASRQGKEIEALKKRRDTEHAKLGQFEEASTSHRDTMQTAKDRLTAAENRIPHLQESIRMLNSGVQAGRNGMTLVEEQTAVQRELEVAKGDQQRGELEIKQLTDEDERVRGSAAADAQRHAELAENVNAWRRAFEEAKEKCTPFVNANRDVQHLRPELEAVQRRLEDHRRNAARADAFPFHFDHVPGAGLEKAVLGRVGTLVRMKAPSYSMALSVGAQAALTRVVVRSDADVDVLINKGNLRQRNTFFPLNKLGPALQKARLDAAEQVRERVGGEMHLAMDLVEYDQQIRCVAEHAFGFFVCSTIELAKALAFDRSVGMRAVTVDGDLVNPNGIMTGGSSQSVRNVMEAFARSQGNDAPLRELQAEIERLEERCRRAEALARQGGPAFENMTVAQRTFEVGQAKLQASGVADAHRTLADIESRTAQLAEEQRRLVAQLTALESRSKEIAHQMQSRDLQAERKTLDKKLKETQQEVRQLRKQVAEDRTSFDDLQAQRDVMRATVEDATAAVTTAEEALEQQEASVAAARASLQAVEEDAAKSDAAVEAKNAEVASLVEAENRLREEEDALNSEEEARRKQLREDEAFLSRATHDHGEAHRQLQQIKAAHRWVADTMSAGELGPADGPFYFEDKERTQLTLDHLQKDESDMEALGRKVNKKATVMFEATQADFEDLVKKREHLSKDKQVILDSIQQVELRKWESLDAMVAKVSTSFSELFGACLPGASCRLVEERDPANGRLTGLAVKVAFSGKEKESLTELSGGQRSLLALCLILAILRFRPAPVYVLDEVDAALDPSHTQNIGSMLAQHFPHAQFLLVSLKDGMYSSANCVFEVRNTQGYSEVSRRAKTR